MQQPVPHVPLQTVPHWPTFKSQAWFVPHWLEVLQPQAPRDRQRGPELLPGQGSLVLEGGRRLAAYRDPDGGYHVLVPKCTHMGCTVGWNDAERTWDCPCHGSRFDVEGKVLQGPAKVELPPVQMPG